MNKVINYHGLEIPKDKIAEFCRRWKIIELSLFGSVLRDDFRSGSDIDVLVTFEPDATWRFYDLMDMKEELETPRDPEIPDRWPAGGQLLHPGL